MREEYGAVAVCFKINSAVELSRGVVEMLDTGRCADDGETESLGDVACRGTVGICGLDHTNPEVGQTDSLNEVCDEGSGEGSNLVTIKEVEDAVSIIEVIDDSISIAVE